MTDINNRNQFRAWLVKQPRKAAVALAARAALRVLPVVQTAKHDAYTNGLVLPVFRAASVAWAAAKYPAYEADFVTRAAYAYAAAVAAAAATATAAAAADAAAIAAADAAAPAYAAVAYAPAYAAIAAAAAYAAVTAVRAAAAAAAAADDAAAACATTRSAAAAARATAAPTVATATAAAAAAAARAAAARAAAAAAAYADDAVYAAAYSDARTYADDAFAYAYAGDTAGAYAGDTASDYAGAAAAPFFWSAVSADATRLEEGTAASVIATLPMWPHGQPDHLRSLWQELEVGLLAANQDWQVWTNWYNDRVDSRVREEGRELAYIRIDEALWNRGPAIVNAEIARRVEGSLRPLGAARKIGSLRPAAKPQDTNQPDQITH